MSRVRYLLASILFLAAVLAVPTQSAKAQAACWLYKFENSSGPNPVSRTGTLYANMDLAVVLSDYSFGTATISFRAVTTSGQTVANHVVGTFPSSSTRQHFPIWSPPNVSGGTYITTLTATSACGQTSRTQNIVVF